MCQRRVLKLIRLMCQRCYCPEQREGVCGHCEKAGLRAEKRQTGIGSTDYFNLISICFGFASARFGKTRQRTPFGQIRLNDDLILILVDVAGRRPFISDQLSSRSGMNEVKSGPKRRLRPCRRSRNGSAGVKPRNKFGAVGLNPQACRAVLTRAACIRSSRVPSQKCPN
jgi:hypothetical protein